MIIGNNVILRALEPTDADILYEWENDMELWKVSNTMKPFSLHELRCYIENSNLDIYQTKQLRLVITRKADNKTIGLIDLYDFEPFHLHGGIGIMVNKAYRNNDYAKEAIELFCNYLSEFLGLHSVFASITADNYASIKVFTHLGFEKNGVKKDWIRCGREFKDELFYQKRF